MKQFLLSSIFILLLSNSIMAMEFFTDINAALLVAEKVQKNIVVIFSMDNCLYCDKLKHDLVSMDHAEGFIVCVLDSDKNQKLIEQHKIRLWPSSIILSSDPKHPLLSVKIGYKTKQDYDAWLNKNKMVSYR